MGAFKDLTGMTFGDFKVIEYTENYHWKCECVKCGYPTTKGTETLKKWKNYCPQCKSPIGKTFGDFKVVSRKDTTDKYEYVYNCECINCGHSAERSRNVLKNTRNMCEICNERYGIPDNVKGYAEDLTGQKFGKLTVLKFAGVKSSHSLWLCQCECTKETVKSIQALHKNKRLMCEECEDKLKKVVPEHVKKENDVELIDDDTIRVNGKILFDKTGWDIVSKYDRYISVNESGYAYMKYKGETIFIHRLLLGLPIRYDSNTQLIGEHKDNNRLNNKLSNLRIKTKPENPKNCTKYKNTKNTYKGTSYHKHINKWGAYIQSNKKSFYCGVYKTEVDAAIAYNTASYFLHGDMANFNPVPFVIDESFSATWLDAEK